MMLPEITGWPPKIFTPRRLLCESRPFFTLPSPFLCAMIFYFEILIGGFRIELDKLTISLPKLFYVSYFDLCVLRSVSSLFVKTLSSFLFVSYHRIALDVVNDLSLDLSFYIFAQ